MSARIIDGVQHARRLRAGLATEIADFVARTGVRPKLTVILVGTDAPSRLYVSNKAKACRDVGIESATVELPASITLPELLAVIDAANEDNAVHGILMQLPLPAHLPVRAVLERISVDKDVDGFHMYNVGGLVLGSTVFSPCTPFGVQKLLEAEQIPIAGQNVVVVGASNIVGKPTALMLMQRDATVCICHAKTRDLAQFTILADILVVAAGRPNLILAPMVKTGAVVIDVGINRLPDGRIVGDVDFDAVRRKASHITPVPGGVGPMTITMLLHNTLVAARALSSELPAHDGAERARL
ncbi:bifunctional 5,10-methylenetetrahydrofolate dehydrogenase/5,10-methenyltetrahydrofolate cyclohydrolase [Peristeroidobacter soli]|jgi:methylenetetrahydrofolate dehydrogenase (NADP+)/methenyltetrahydrofolate cyclohydrolase|uniref:bifunctional 5,10-methylenetetrahydrofolate dehydrogenase/5,10-methenyltetrahydrofolate cyclohydrolase n=1 Tax=Peristeroidobacter soli TaxID=2497877 RepID=UPI00101DA3F2|nr:bifunctional 5,10-methylenetetrahydrofolate dehydrogenase/5,10-methenyltetrahydrofolate cyclohydrolase [Peristeroidobacter soli]